MHKFAGLFVLMWVLVVVATHEHQNEHHKEEHAHPKYEFEYGVHDPHTHDAKKQWEKRDGDVVKGSYRVIQPDGRIRIVNYYADDKIGFNAEVKYIGKAKHPAVAKAHSSGSSQPQGFIRGFAQGFVKGMKAHEEEQNRWKAKTPLGSGSYRYVPQTIGYAVDHSSGRTQSSALGLGYSMGPAGGLDSTVYGFDTREPHGSALIFNSDEV